jgi:hypothetical protein
MFYFKKSLVLLMALLFPIFTFAQTCRSLTTTSTSHFTVNSNGTVSDSRTGLMWKKCSEGQSGINCDGNATTYTWEKAQELNKGSSFAGYNNWRIPNVKELLSIVEEQCSQPAINLKVFPNTQSSALYFRFWSSLHDTSDGSMAWLVFFKNGKSNSSYKWVDSYVRLVR